MALTAEEIQQLKKEGFNDAQIERASQLSNEIAVVRKSLVEQATKALAPYQAQFKVADDSYARMEKLNWTSAKGGPALIEELVEHRDKIKHDQTHHWRQSRDHRERRVHKYAFLNDLITLYQVKGFLDKVDIETAIEQPGRKQSLYSSFFKSKVKELVAKLNVQTEAAMAGFKKNKKR